MKKFYFKSKEYVKGSVSSIYFTVNTVFWCVLMYPIAFLKWVSPVSLKRFWKSLSIRVAESWISTNNLFIKYILAIRMKVVLPQSLKKNRSYLVISNHRSWVDILALQFSMNGRLPFFRFFIKDNLKWVPFIGLAWKLLDYPFMKRYSKTELLQKPNLKMRDIEAAKEACRKLVGEPASLLIFLEGTRFSKEKRIQLKSKFKNLLPPKVGGATSVLDVLGQQIHSVVDVTIVYPDGVKSFWNMLSGRMRQVVVEVREIEIPEKFRCAGLSHNFELRQEFENWVNQIWEEKDARIAALQLSHG